MKKLFACQTLYVRNHTSYDFHLCIYGLNDNTSMDFFFHFSKNLIFQAFRGGRGVEGGWGLGSKEQKIVHKILCPLHLISKEPYIIWLSFVVRKCKLVISPGSFFQNFDFSVKGQKMVQNEKRFYLLNCYWTVWLLFVVDKSKMTISPGAFFIFSKFLFYGLLVG